MKAVFVTFMCLVALHAVAASRDHKEWKMIRSARADEPITFHVALHQRNTDLLEVIFYIFLNFSIQVKDAFVPKGHILGKFARSF